MKRSARDSWRTTRICAGVIGGSSGSSGSGSATGAGTAATGRSASAGAAGAVGGASGLGLGLFLEPGGLPRRLGAGGAGSGSGWAAGAVGRGRKAQTARQQPPPLSGSSLPSLSSKHLLPRARPTSPSAVEVYAEADAGASQVHEIAFIIRQLETEVLQRDGASQVYHVILVGVRLHDVPHALLADDLRDDVVAQRAHCLGCIRQAATAKVNF